MAIISKQFGRGGVGLNGGTGGAGIREIVLDVADDLAGLKLGTIATANASDLASVITLANALKVAINAQAAYTVKTTKET